MTYYLILTVLAVLALAATLRSVLHDGPARPPRSHAVDTDFLTPSSRV